MKKETSKHRQFENIIEEFFVELNYNHIFDGVLIRCLNILKFLIF